MKTSRCQTRTIQSFAKTHCYCKRWRAKIQWC